jgi:hypothetical protein
VSDITGGHEDRSGNVTALSRGLAFIRLSGVVERDGHGSRWKIAIVISLDELL